jgi:hypothetical protein
MKLNFILILILVVVVGSTLFSQVKSSPVEKKTFYKPTLNPNSNTVLHKGKLFHFEIENTFKKLPSLTIVFTDVKGNQQLFTCCSDNGGLESSDDDARRSLVNGIVLGKNFLKINLEDYKLKDGDTCKMTIKGLQKDLFMNFKYESR